MVNARGRGSELREEIVRAAARLLSSAASRDGVTLRAIAREAGIAAPSIYPHFPDRDAILDAVVSATFAELEAACRAAAGRTATAAERLGAICAAYTSFGRERPDAYRILFERSGPNVGEAHPYAAGIRTFRLLADTLADMVMEGSSTSTDPDRDAQSLWVALHGLLTLVPATPGFPWQPADELIVNLITALTATAELPGGSRPLVDSGRS